MNAKTKPVFEHLVRELADRAEETVLSEEDVTKFAKQIVELATDGRVPCPTCKKLGRWETFTGPAVEKVIWEGYPGLYAGCKPPA